MVDWQTITLEDGLDRLIDYRGKSPPKSTSGIPVISAKVVKNGRIIQPISQMIDRDYYSFWMTRGFPRVGDIVMTTEGPLGELAQLDAETAQYALGQRIVCMRGKVGVLDNTFLKLLLGSPAVQAQLSSFATGTTVAGISQKSLRTIPIRIPPYEEQVAIGKVLDALDQKIDLNQRMSRTLETIARVIFKDWFVDFGPTRAKIDARPPYLPPEIWQLFPDRLDDEGKPKGWSFRPLDRVANFLNGLALQKYPTVGQSYLPVIKIAELRAGTTRGSDKASADVPTDYVIENGDVLFSWSGSLLHRVWCGGRGALNQHLFKVTSSQYPKWFYFHWIGHYMDSFQAIAASKATTMGHIQRHHLAEAATVVPDDQIILQADALIAPLFERRFANDLEAQTLASLRDLLLPKIMSGEIPVRHAKKLEAVL